MYKVSDGIDEKTKEIKDYSTGTVVQPMKGYEPNIDYEARIQRNIKDGDYVSAAQNERMRNLKIADTGLPYAPTNRFNYQDATQYGREKLLGEIGDYTKKGFSYNPDNDAVYQSLNKRYKEQALDNYNDNITSLAAQYGGEIPAYLKQIAKNNYQIEAGKANDAIPTLSQMAWDMWADTRNDLYNQYGLLDAQESKDYNRFNDNRNYITGASESMYNRKVTDRQMDQTDRQLNNDDIRLMLQQDEYRDSKNYKIGDTIFGLKDYYRKLGYSEQQADRMAKNDYVQLYGGYIPSAVSSGGVAGNNPIGGTVPGKRTTEAVIEDEKDAEKATIYIDEDGNIKVRD